MIDLFYMLTEREGKSFAGIREGGWRDGDRTPSHQPDSLCTTLEGFGNDDSNIRLGKEGGGLRIVRSKELLGASCVAM